MPRQKKDGSYLNLFIRQDIRDELKARAEAERRTITAIVELALTEYYHNHPLEDSSNK